MAAGSFETVIAQSQMILAENQTSPPADIALYAMGEVYAHYNYPGRNFALSQIYFETLIENFPASPLSAEAKTYINLFETIKATALETAVAEKKLSQQKKEFAARKKTDAPHPPVSRPVVTGGNFTEAEEKNMKKLEEAGNKKPADEALYNLGLIYAHSDNPAKDYKKSKLYFHVLTTQFPTSEYAEEARIMLGLFETIEKMQQIDLEIEQQKKQLSR